MKTVWSLKIDKVLNIGYNLKEIGVNNWALNKSEAIEALDKLEKLGVSILGGDVYEDMEGIIQPNYDSWHCDKLLEESFDEFINRSINKARDYIENYNVKDSEKIFFLIVPHV